MKTSKILSAILFFILVLSLLSGCGKTEESEPAVFYSNENNRAGYTMENEYLHFSMDGATSYFTLTDKKSGEVWHSVPENGAEDPMADATMKKWLQSTMIVTYTIPSGLNTIFDNYSNSIESGSFQIEQLEDGSIRVDYLIGEQVRMFIIPEILSEERFEALISGMEKNEKSAVKAIYRKLDPANPPSGETAESLLEKYPMTAEGIVYVQREGVAEYRCKQVEELLAQYGYTYEDYENDKIVADDEETLLQFNVSVIYSLDGNALTAQIPGESLRCPDGYLMTNLQVLPYFGAGSTEDEGYLLIPDGGGAIIDFNTRNGTATSVSSKVYGWNSAKVKEQMISENAVSFPVFGIQKNSGYLLAITESGAGELTMEANTSGDRNSYNTVIPSFEVVHGDMVYVSSKSNVQVLVEEKNRQYEDICIHYFAGSGDSYVDMAGTYRDYLLEKYPDLTAIETGSIPVAVELIGAMDHIKQVVGIPMQQVLPATTYAEASQLVDQLQMMNIAELHLKYTAVLNSGLKQTSLQKYRLVSELGSTKELQALAQKVTSAGGEFYLGGYGSKVLDTKAFDGFNENNDAIRNTLSDIVEAKPYHIVTYRQIAADKYFILNEAASRTAMGNLAKAAGEYGFTGVAFEDIGSRVSSDFNRETPTTRDSMARAQGETLEQFRQNGQSVMISGGNDYAVVHADFVLNMDLTGSSYDLVSRQVPFYQIALHGLVNYAAEPINMAESYETNLLKSIETGAGLYFVFAEISPMDLQMTEYTVYSSAQFNQWKETMESIYQRLNGDLGHTYSLRIVDHQYLTEQVTVTVYEDGTHVYVNYGSKDFTVSGKTVQAKDYLVTGGK